MKCFITGKRSRVGNSVSKSNRKTKRRFKVNFQACKSYICYTDKLSKLSCKGLRTLKKLCLITKLN